MKKTRRQPVRELHRMRDNGARIPLNFARSSQAINWLARWEREREIFDAERAERLAREGSG